MNIDWLKIIFKRFAKMFAFGGISSALVYVAGHPLTDFSNWRSWIAILITAFFTGGLAAIEKYSQGYNP